MTGDEEGAFSCGCLLGVAVGLIAAASAWWLFGHIALVIR